MIFKSIDKKISELGFKEVRNDQYGIEYERNNGNYTHKVVLLHKQDSDNIMQSYDPALFDYKSVGNTCVGLTQKELKLFAKKMKCI